MEESGMSYIEDIKEVRKNMQESNFGLAKEKLEEMLEECKECKLEDDENIYRSFNNVIEEILYFYRNNPKKRLVYPEKNMAEIYYTLGYIELELNNNDAAMKYLIQAEKWNPMDPLIKFEIAVIFRRKGQVDRFRAEIEKLFPYVYNSYGLAKFYREMGWYYSERKVWDVANALYTNSLSYYVAEVANNELKYIAQMNNREVKHSTQEEIKRLLWEYNMPIGFSKDVHGILKTEYEKQIKEENRNERLINELSRRLYDITLDKKYVIYTKLYDEEENIEVSIPEFWKILNKEAYSEYGINENTMFVFLITDTKNYSIMNEGECKEEEFEEKYNSAIENIKKYGMKVLLEDEEIIDNEKYKISIIEIKLEDDKVQKLYQVYRRIDNKLIKCSWEVPALERAERIKDVEKNSMRFEVVKSIKNKE